MTRTKERGVFRHMCLFPRRHVLDVRGSAAKGVPAGGKRVDKHRESSGLDAAHHENVTSASQAARWGTDSLIELIGHARAGDHCSGTHWPSNFYG